MTNAALIAIFKAILKMYPGLAWGAVLLELQNMGEDVLAEFKKWWEMEMPEPWPGMPEMPLPHPQGPPSDDPLMP